MQSETDKAAQILEAVRTLAEIFNRRLSDSALTEWTDALLPLHGPELMRSLKDGCRQRHMPGLVDIIETTQAAKRRNAEVVEARISFDEMVRTASTPEARAAAEKCLAILREKFS